MYGHLLLPEHVNHVLSVKRSKDGHQSNPSNFKKINGQCAAFEYSTVWHCPRCLFQHSFSFFSFSPIFSLKSTCFLNSRVGFISHVCFLSIFSVFSFSHFHCLISGFNFANCNWNGFS